MKEKALTPTEGAPRFDQMRYLIENKLDYEPEPKWKQFQQARKEDRQRAAAWSGNRVANTLPPGDR